ncbi:hypothetical protein SUGI_0717240 [Cryptomeria japonica]|nr:hypothetical protein SUGI_0717240 [Cryptomeria japonica]
MRLRYLVVVIICASVAGALALFIVLWAWINVSQYSSQQKEKIEDEGEDDDVDWLSGLPVRFSFQELQDVTYDFSIKLGSRRFRSIFEGVLSDHSKIALKRLDQRRKRSDNHDERKVKLLNMHFTEKADIISFGVVVIEIVSRKRSREFSQDNLFSLLQVKTVEGKLIYLVYPGLESEESCIKEKAVKLLKLGMWCV